MFLDYVEPLLQLPYKNDLSIAIFILKLFCNKFNFFNESYEDNEHIDRIKFRYYLQNTFKEEINRDNFFKFVQSQYGNVSVSKKQYTV